jgi:hypothetical protein
MSYTGVTGVTQLAQMLASDKSLLAEVRKILNYKEYADDIIQDLLLQIMLSNESYMVQICQRNEFNYWIYAVAKTKRGTSSYMNRNVEITDENVQFVDNSFIYKQEHEHKQFLVQIIKEELLLMYRKNKTTNYSYRIFSDYIRLKEEYKKRNEKLTFRKFSKEMDVDKDSLFQVIKKVKIRLKNRLNDYL